MYSNTPKRKLGWKDVFHGAVDIISYCVDWTAVTGINKYYKGCWLWTIIEIPLDCYNNYDAYYNVNCYVDYYVSNSDVLPTSGIIILLILLHRADLCAQLLVQFIEDWAEAAFHCTNEKAHSNEDWANATFRCTNEKAHSNEDWANATFRCTNEKAHSNEDWANATFHCTNEKAHSNEDWANATFHCTNEKAHRNEDWANATFHCTIEKTHRKMSLLLLRHTFLRATCRRLRHFYTVVTSLNR